MIKQAITQTNGTATAQEVVDCARSFIGTPYGDYGRDKNRALDCIGLPILVSHELGLIAGDFSRYTPTPKQRHAEHMGDLYMGKIVWQRPGWPDAPKWTPDVQLVATQPGDVGLFWFSHRSEPTHFAIFAQHPMDPSVPTMIHAHARLGKCVEHSMDDFWKRRLIKTYRLPNVKG